MKIKLISLLSFLAFLTGCHSGPFNKNASKLELVRITNYKLDGLIKSKNTALYKSIISTNTKEFRYYLPSMIDTIKKDTFYFSYVMSRDDNSFLLVDNKKCPLTGKKSYKIDNNDFVINKYLYDEENSFDEEKEILINDSVGLIQVYSLVWGIISTHIKDSLTSQLNRALITDTTLFVMKESNIHVYNKNLIEKIKKQKQPPTSQ